MDAGVDGRLGDLGDQRLVLRVALAVAGEVAEVAAGREQPRHARELRDLARCFHALERLDHQEQHDVVVPGLPVAARHLVPQLAGSLPAAGAAPADGREVGPVDRGLRLFDAVDGRDHDDQRAHVGGVLDLTLVGIGHARAGGCRSRTGAPHPGDLLPRDGLVLHLDPDEVVAGRGHRAVGARVGGAHRAADHRPAGHELGFGRVPDLGGFAVGQGEARAVLEVGGPERLLFLGGGILHGPADQQAGGDGNYREQRGDSHDILASW